MNPRLALALFLTACATESPSDAASALDATPAEHLDITAADSLSSDLAVDGQDPDVADPAPDTLGEPDALPSDGASGDPDVDTPGECTEGQTECLSYTQERRCVQGKWTPGECAGDNICLESACGPPVCPPNTIQCLGAQRQLCDDIGSGWATVAAPAGFG